MNWLVAATAAASLVGMVGVEALRIVGVAAPRPTAASSET